MVYMSSCTFETKISDNKLEIYLPIKTVSEGNCFEPWQKKHKRHKNGAPQINMRAGVERQTSGIARRGVAQALRHPSVGVFVNDGRWNNYYKVEKQG